MSTLTALVSRRAALDYARRPLNLVLLVAIPVVLVFVWGPTLADFSELVGGSAGGIQVEAATAGWATAVLAGLGGFFQVSGSRAADRRLAAAGKRTAPVVAGRLGTCMGLVVVTSAGGLAALALRSGLNDPGRAVAATLLVGVIYMALGVLVGTGRALRRERGARDHAGLDHRRVPRTSIELRIIRRDLGVSTPLSDARPHQPGQRSRRTLR